jgi:hypothetical protein
MSHDPARAGRAELRRTQELFWSLITAPEGVRPAVADLARSGRMAPTAVDDVFLGDDRLAATERLDIYANMYFFRLRDALAEDYPVVLAALGPDRFHNLVTDYLLRHPSEHPSLRHLGRHLPGFIHTHALGRELRYLADLARLDWARVEVFDAPDATTITRDDLARLRPEQAGEARFALIPACDILRFEYDVARLWKTLKERDAAPAGPDAAVRRPARLRVWRKDLVVYHQSIDEDEADCLDLLRAGEPLGRMAQQLAAGRSVEQAAGHVGRLLQAWLEDGLLASITVPD